MLKNMHDTDPMEQDPNKIKSSVNNRILEDLAIALTDHGGWGESQWYVDITDGTVISISSELLMLDPSEYEDLPEWQKDSLELLDHETIMIDPVPSHVSFGIMEDFVATCNLKHQAFLFNALGKKHPFARFRQSVEYLGLLKNWYDFKNKAEYQMAERWLEKNDLTIQNGKIVRISK